MRRKKDYMTVESLGGAKMYFGKDDGWTIKATIEHGKQPIHITYYREQPYPVRRWKDWNGVTVPEDKQIVIRDWWRLHDVDLKAVAAEVKDLIEYALFMVMMS